MFNGMGIQWASTLLGCVAAALVPIPVVFYLYGHKIRERSKFAPTMPANMPSRAASTAGPGAGNGNGNGNEPGSLSSADPSEKGRDEDVAAASNVPRTASGREQA